eukprot:gene14254-biopygen8082
MGHERSRLASCGPDGSGMVFGGLEVSGLLCTPGRGWNFRRTLEHTPYRQRIETPEITTFGRDTPKIVKIGVPDLCPNRSTPPPPLVLRPWAGFPGGEGSRILTPGVLTVLRAASSSTRSLCALQKEEVWVDQPHAIHVADSPTTKLIPK